MIYLILFSVVIIGGLIAFRINEKNQVYINLLLSFSGAYLLSIIVFHLLPGLYHKIPGKTAGVFIMLGIIFQLILELFSHGAEHGHQQRIMTKTPWLLFISLSIHSFLEGLPINEGQHFHYTYLYGILIHKLPISIVLTSVMILSNIPKKIIFFFLVIFASTSPLAAYLASKLEFMSHYGAYINAFVIGILAHIGTTILFENEHSHHFNLRKFLLIISALIIAYLT